MSRLLRTRLSLMMFLQYFAPGVLLPILSYYVQHYLHFTPLQAGAVLAAPAVAAFLAPPIIVRVSDRIIPAERLLATCHLLAGLLMLLLAYQTTFAGFFTVYLVQSLVFMPTMALANTVAFHHARDPRRDFSAVRLWGTAGWAAAGWVFGYLWVKAGWVGTPETRIPDALWVAAVTSLTLAFYAFSLPTNKTAQRRHEADPKPSTALWRRPGVLLILVLAFLGSFLNEYYTFGISPFLSQAGFAAETIMPAITLGQVTELATMAVLGILLARFGTKTMMTLGMAFQALRFFLFAWGGHKALILLGASLHGPFYTFFTTTTYILMDQRSEPHEKTASQQLINIAVFGFGRLLGSLCAGLTAEYFLDPTSGVINYTGFWLVAALGGCASIVLLWLCVPVRQSPRPPATT